MEVMGDEWDGKEGRSLLQILGARVEPFCAADTSTLRDKV